MTPLVLGEVQLKQLSDLRALAAEHPVRMKWLTELIADPIHKAAHMAQMSRQTVVLPFGFCVTFSIELEHPVGACRHMSMSSPAKGRAPSPEAVDMVADVLGFVGGFRACSVWLEDLERGGDEKQKAVNLVQPIAITQETGNDAGRN
jgi:hypothetical protein